MHFSWLSSFSPLEDHKKEDLTWGMNTTVAVRKVAFWWVSEEECPSEIPRVLLQLHLPQPSDLLPRCIWRTTQRQETPQRVINSSEKITGCPLPSLPSSTPAFGSSLQGSRQQIDGLNLTLSLNILFFTPTNLMFSFTASTNHSGISPTATEKAPKKPWWTQPALDTHSYPQGDCKSP